MNIEQLPIFELCIRTINQIDLHCSVEYIAIKRNRHTPQKEVVVFPQGQWLYSVCQDGVFKGEDLPMCAADEDMALFV